MSDVAIPDTIDALTPDWLSASLAESGALPSGRVSGFESDRIGVGEGLIGDVYRLRLRVDPGASGAPRTLIAKFPTAEKRTRATAELMGAYEREILFYRELASEVPCRTPRCYGAALEPRPGSAEGDARVRALVNAAPFWLLRALVKFGRFLAGKQRRPYALLLEDLFPAHPGDQLAGADDADLRAAVETLARVHARFWRADELYGRRWLIGLDANTRPMQLEFRAGRGAFEARFRDSIPASVRGLLAWIDRFGEDLLKRFSAHPPTLVHADYRLDNLFFDRREAHDATEERAAEACVRVGVIDWQAASRGPGVYDLAYFVSSSAMAADLDADALIGLYHLSLVANGVEDYPLEQCRHEYREALLLMVQRLVAAVGTVDMPNERSRALTEQWVARLMSHVDATDFDAIVGDRANA